jgi:4-hydroxybenzoate polyprenyltransferase
LNAEERKYIPLVIDLDGTLTPADTLVESVICLLKKNPLNLINLILWLLGGRAAFKQRVAENAGFSPAHLPWRPDLLEWLAEERSSGRRIVLATAAHSSIAEAVSHHIGIFDSTLASDAGCNLKGLVKLAAIRQHIGEIFVYAGDSHADLPIWRAAKAAVLVGTSPSVSRILRETVVIEKEFTYPVTSWRVWLRALRMHQWVKNLLLCVPLFTAFAFDDGSKVLAAVLGFFAFSLAASGTYILNDLWDLDSDRQHPRKKNRPFASAQIPLIYGVAMACILLVLALILALSASLAFTGMLVGYLLLTTSYSWALKRYVLIDVLMLAILYTFRVLAGSVVTEISVTPWLLAFSIFTFFSLALVKRCAELVLLQASGKHGTHGRDYRVGDLVVLWPLGIGASLCSTVVFGLYIGSPGIESRYRNTEVLWLVGIGLIYWIARLWIKTARGEMHDDPIVFAIKDFGSRVTLLTMIALTIFAHFLG